MPRLWHDDDDDARRDAIDERRRFRRATQCRCGGDMPGFCPGPAACPMCDEPEEASDEGEAQ